MTNYTGAQNVALELFQSRDPRALHLYLERWRAGVHTVSSEFVLAVIHYYNSMTGQASLPDIVVGPLRISLKMQRVYWSDKDVDLTMTEFRVVKLFADNLDGWLTYRAVYDVVHCPGFIAGCGNEGYRTNVRSIIKRLRRKFERVDPSWKQIENYNGYGYRWLKPDLPMIVTPIDGMPLATEGPAQMVSGG